MINKIMKPFAYLIISLIDGKRYYGIRFSKDADPSQLWTTYFTSSREILSKIKKHGVESFTAEVRRVFETAEQAINWESRFLTRINAATREDWINRSNGYKALGEINTGKVKPEGYWENWKMVRKGHTVSEETKKKIGDANRGRKQTAEANEKRRAASTGLTHTEETKQKIREAALERKHSPETIAKIKAARQLQTEQGRLRNSVKQPPPLAHK